jgi:REP element-mobilizing transposase RayT
MARKLRLEFPGAIYHVINRGNYRAWIFKDVGAAAAFEGCLFDACERSKWLLHAFVIMGNHYHLAVETPQGNLVAGMQWLQSTFANRFNKLRGERGHLFQGRYKSLLIEAGDPLGQVCHYVHLNPVRAAIVPVERLGEHRFSSYWYLRRPERRPACLQVSAALAAAGSLSDTKAGWNRYADYLAWQAAEGPAGRNAAYVSLTRGWAIGSPEFKRALLQDHEVATTVRAWESEGVREVRAARWSQALTQALARLPGKARRTSTKSAAWKVAVAAHMKATTDVPNGWLAEQLGMGSPFYVSKHVGCLRRQPNGDAARWLGRLRKVKGKA